jgi:hypothetical protein
MSLNFLSLTYTNLSWFSYVNFFGFVHKLRKTLLLKLMSNANIEEGQCVFPFYLCRKQLGLSHEHYYKIRVSTTWLQKSRYFYDMSVIGWVTPIALIIIIVIHHIWNHILIESMFNFMLLDATTLQLGCPCRSLVQNNHK